MTLLLAMTYIAGTLVTLATGFGGTYVAFRNRIRVPAGLSIAILTFSSYGLLFQLLKLHANKNYADFAVWLDLLTSIRRGLGPWSSLQDAIVPGTGHFFSAHFTPLLYIFSVPFYFVPTPETLLTSQFLFLSTTLVALYVYSRRYLGDTGGALAVAAIASLYLAYQYIHLYEFEMLRFSIPLLLFTFYALEEGKLGMYWIFLALSLLVREEVSLTVFCLGLYAVLFMPHRRRVGMAAMAVSIGYFLLVMKVVMPFFRTEGSAEHWVFGYWFAKLGSTIPEILIGILTKPDVVLPLVTDPIKLANLFMYGLPLMFVPLLAWPVLLITAANVGVGLLGPRGYVSYFLYYLSPSIPFLFIAFVKGAARLGGWLDGRWGAPDRERRGTGAVLCGVLSAAVVANFFFGPSPLSLPFWVRGYTLAPFRTLNFHYSQYIVTEHARKLKEALAVIPGGEKVSAEQHILPALAGRADLKVFPDITGVRYVVLDKLRKEKTGVGIVPGSWHGLRENPQYYYDWVERNPAQWQLVFRLDGYFVYKRRESRS